MKHKAIFVSVVFFILFGCSYGAERFEFINPRCLSVKISADKKEIKTGETATFTVSITNRSDKPVKLHFNRPWRFDLVCMRKGRQIYRYSSGLQGGFYNYYLSLAPGKSICERLGWRALNKRGQNAKAGVYTAFGMAVLAEKTLVSSKDCSITVLPLEVKPEETIKASLNGFFNIELPLRANNKELVWHIEYLHNDNRLALYKILRQNDKITYTFKAKRAGHARLNMLAHCFGSTAEDALERRAYFVEVN